MTDRAGSLSEVFPGLRPFEPEETHLFFGRDGQSDEVIRRLALHRFLAIVGTSGSGKSSLVRAGVLPSLRGGSMSDAGSSWRIALMKPGLNPLASLAEALNRSFMRRRNELDAAARLVLIETTLRRSSFGLVESARQAEMDSHENLLVVVDQFEEIFRLKNGRKSGLGDDDEAAAFVKLLLEAARQVEVPIYVVITMRSDYIGACSEYRGLPEVLNDGQYLVPRLTRDQRRQAIEGPIAVGQATITARLVQRLLNDVGDDPDHLPILQHALMRTWEAWRKLDAPREPIDLPHYETIGTMARALSQHADEAFGELDDAGRQIAHRMFKRLSEKDPDGREVSRPTRLGEICAVANASPEAVVAVIDRFRTHGRTFLTPPSPSPLGAESVIDISHESLIRLWVRLRAWTQAEAESAVLYRRLADASARHAAAVASLWRDPELQLALDWKAREQPNEAWAARYGGDFNTALRFLELSREEREQARRIRRSIFVGSITLAVVFGVLGLFSLRELREARRLAALSVSRDLASQSELVRNEDPDQTELAALLAVEGARHADLVQTNRILYDTMRLLPVSRLRFPGSPAPDLSPVSVALGADGRHLARASGGIVRVLDTHQGEEVLKLSDQDGVRAVALSPDGQYLVLGKDYSVEVFRIATGRRIWSRTTVDPVAVALSVNAQQVALSFASRVEVYNLQNNVPALLLPRKGERDTSATEPLHASADGPPTRERAPSRLSQAGYRAIAFSADGNLFAAGGSNVDNAVYDLRTGAKLYQLSGVRHIGAIAFSRNNDYVVAGGEEISLFDQTTGVIRERFGVDQGVSALAIGADSRYVAAADQRSIQLFEVASSKRVAVLSTVEPIDDMAFGPQSRYLLVDTPARLLVFGPIGNRHFTFAEASVPGTAALSPGGRYLALAFERRNDAVYRKFDLGSGKELAVLSVSPGFTGGAALSGDGRYIATLPNSFGAVPIFDTTTGKPQADSLVAGAYSAMAFSSDGLNIAVARDPLGKSRDAATEILVAKRMDPTYLHPLDTEFPVTSLAFSPSGVYLAAAGKDSIALYDASSRQRVAQINVSSDARSVAATDDARYAMTTGSRFIIYSMASGAEVFSEPTPEGSDKSMVLNNDGTGALVASSDQTEATIAEFPGDLRKVIEETCARLDRNLSPAEWSRYLGSETYRKTCPNLP